MLHINNMDLARSAEVSLVIDLSIYLSIVSYRSLTTIII